MGLFSNNKKLCPICGNPTPRVFPTIIEDQAICKECNGKRDMPDDMLGKMSLEDFRRYIDFYNENKKLRDAFRETSRIDFGFLEGKLVWDATHGLLKLKDKEKAFAIEGSYLESFRILEDNTPLFESDGNVLRCHKTNVEGFVNSLAPEIDKFAMRLALYEEMQRIEEQRRWERERNGETVEPSLSTPPAIDLPVPFENFYVELNLTHPYWSSFRGKMESPRFNRYDPSINSYMEAYKDRADKLHAAAVDFMQMMSPGAQEVWDGADNGTAFAQAARPQTARAVQPQAAQAGGWTCSCGAVNKGRFCQDCGAKKPEGVPQYQCDKCGWQPEDPTHPPKFCPECGDPFDENDRV